MKLTIDTLREIGTCSQGAVWFARRYPDGIDVSSVTPHDVVEALRAGLCPEWLAFVVERRPALSVLRDIARSADVRAAAIALGEGYCYARYVDQCPRDDTRAAAIAGKRGYSYARYVDGSPRDDTRAAAIREGVGYEYARDVDCAPRDDTRAAAIRERKAYGYAINIDHAPREDTRAAAIREGRGEDYAEHFAPPKRHTPNCRAAYGYR